MSRGQGEGRIIRKCQSHRGWGQTLFIAVHTARVSCKTNLQVRGPGTRALGFPVKG